MAARKKSKAQASLAGMGGKYTLNMFKGHQTYRTSRGDKCVGVTTITGMLDKPALVRWANKMGLQGVDTTKFVQKAADIGTVTHARIEAFLREMEFDTDGLDPNIIKQSEHGFSRFVEWWKQEDLEVEACEIQMSLDRLRVGGTADILARRLRDNKRILLDIKTSSGVFKEMKIQVAGGYAQMLSEIHNEPDANGLFVPVQPRPVDEVWIVRVGKEETDPGDLVFIPAGVRAKCEAVFEAMVPLYYELQGLQ